MGLSVTAAELKIDELLSQNLSVDELKSRLVSDVFEKLDVTDPNANVGAKTILYSGYDVSDLVGDPNNRMLNNTEAYQFLYDKDTRQPNAKLLEALREIYGPDINLNDYNSPAGQFLGGIDGDPRTPGAWDTISKKFVSETEGEVTTLVGEKAGTDRVFFQTELDALKNNPDVTSINGTPTDEFKTSITDMNNEETINKFKTDTEARRIVSTQPDGTLDTNKLTSLSQSDVKEAIVKDPIKSNALSTYESDL